MLGVDMRSWAITLACVFCCLEEVTGKLQARTVTYLDPKLHKDLPGNVLLKDRQLHFTGFPKGTETLLLADSAAGTSYLTLVVVMCCAVCLPRPLCLFVLQRKLCRLRHATDQLLRIYECSYCWKY